MKKLFEHYEQQYTPLIEEFVHRVEESGAKTEGIPQPHLPVIGKNYEQAKYKFAFYGRDTNGWIPLDSFIADYHKAVNENGPIVRTCLQSAMGTVEDGEYFGWRNNFHTSFWDFIVKFLSAFYRTDEKNFEENCKELHNSFVWGNTNAIELYGSSSAQNGVSEEDYAKVKESSRMFDCADNMLSTLQPDVLVVLNWSESEEWLTQFKDRKDVVCESIGDHLRYFYIRSTNTHVFWTSHPRWLAQNIGFAPVIQTIISKLSEYNVWNRLPESPADWKEEEQAEVCKNSMEYKRRLIKNIADCCFDNGLLMSGDELCALFNRNGIETTYGTEYAADGGRGIYTVIRKVWSYFYHEKKDYITAYHIARTFVTKDGDYAYEHN